MESYSTLLFLLCPIFKISTKPIGSNFKIYSESHHLALSSLLRIPNTISSCLGYLRSLLNYLLIGLSLTPLPYIADLGNYRGKFSLPYKRRNTMVRKTQDKRYTHSPSKREHGWYAAEPI